MKAWEELYLRFMPLVYGVCLKILKSEEKSEDTAMYLFQLLPDYFLRYQIKAFKPWLFTVAKNHCYTLIKKEKTEKENAFEFIVVENDVTDDEIISEKPLKELSHCLNKLNEDQKSCVELFYYEKKSYQEIMEIKGLSLSKVKSHIQNGKRNLKNCIES